MARKFNDHLKNPFKIGEIVRANSNVHFSNYQHFIGRITKIENDSFYGERVTVHPLRGATPFSFPQHKLSRLTKTTLMLLKLEGRI